VGSEISVPPSATLIDVKKKRHTVHEESANKRTRMRAGTVQFFNKRR
jgi:hypothetical protein